MLYRQRCNIISDISLGGRLFLVDPTDMTRPIYIDALINHIITTRNGSLTQASFNDKLSACTNSIEGQSGNAIQMNTISPVSNSTFPGGNTVFGYEQFRVVDTCYKG